MISLALDADACPIIVAAPAAGTPPTSITEDGGSYGAANGGGAGSGATLAIRDFTFAAKVKGIPGIPSTQFFLPPTPPVTYSACLVSKIEEMFATGKAPYPAERTLIVSGMLEACLTSRIQGHKRLETPHLKVAYLAPKQSHYPRE